MSYINRNRARQTGTNRTTKAEISNAFWLSFAGRVTLRYTNTSTGTNYRADHFPHVAFGLSVTECGVTAAHFFMVSLFFHCFLSL